MRPDAVASTSPRRSPMSHWGTTTWDRSGAALTAAGAAPSHLVRRSRQRTECPSHVRCHDGGTRAAPEAGAGGTVVVLAIVVADGRFSATDGERLFSKTPAGPTRR